MNEYGTWSQVGHEIMSDYLNKRVATVDNIRHAPLIAAAPDLLDVCNLVLSPELNTLVSMCKPNSDVADVLTALQAAACAAIAKTKGQS